MAQIKLHGRKAYIFQYFNDLPQLCLMEFKNKEKPDRRWSLKTWENRLMQENHIEC